LLIVDEVSMLRADVLDAMDFMLRFVRRNNLPFGGVQLIFIGDLLQLPPVVKSEEWQVLQKFYRGIYFFNAHVLQDYPPVYIELDKVFRQTDYEFLDILNAIRENAINNKHLEILQKHVDPNFDIRKNSDTLVLTTHNRKADKINNETNKTRTRKKTEKNPTKDKHKQTRTEQAQKKQNKKKTHGERNKVGKKQYKRHRELQDIRGDGQHRLPTGKTRLLSRDSD